MERYTNKFGVLKKFDRTILFQVIRQDGKFKLKSPTGKIGWLEEKTTFALLAQAQARWIGGVVPWSTSKKIGINPRAVLRYDGPKMAHDLLQFAGLVKLKDGKWIVAENADELLLAAFDK